MIISSSAMREDRNILKLVSEALNKVNAAIGSVVGPEAAFASLVTLEGLYQDVYEMMQRAYYFVSDEWERIEKNSARLYELSMFMNDYDTFRRNVIMFDDWRIDNQSYSGDCDVAMDLILLVGEWDRRFSYVFNFIRKDNDGVGGMPCLKGLASRLSGFMYGYDDEVLSRAILHKDFPVLKGTWTGRKNEATYFGKHFHLSCEEMNMLFAFAGKDRRSMKLHYTRNDDDKIISSDRIAMILSDYRI